MITYKVKQEIIRQLLENNIPVEQVGISIKFQMTEVSSNILDSLNIKANDVFRERRYKFAIERDLIFKTHFDYWYDIDVDDNINSQFNISGGF